MNTDALRLWFGKLTAARILSMVGAQQENRQLEFKLIGSAAFTSDSDKSNLARALSGFANAEGGIVVWGVEARRDPQADHIDQVIRAPGVSNGNLALSRLNELAPAACSPVPAGVDHRVVRSSKRNLVFLATLVPPSDSGPHMARLGEDRYYVRSGGSFLKMEHFQVADMFGRRARPILLVEPDTSAARQGEVSLRITNTGRGAARAVFIQLWANAPFFRNTYGVDGSHHEDLPVLRPNKDGSWIHAANADAVLHPTMSLRVGGVWLGFDPFRQGSPSIPEKCVIRFKVGALGVAPSEGSFEVPIKGLMQAE